MTDIPALLAKFAQTPDGWLLNDPVARRRRLAEIMAEHDDPLVREMGRQLRDGEATPLQLLGVPEYAEGLRGGIARLAETDYDEIDEAVDDWLERERERDEDDREPGRD